MWRCCIVYGEHGAGEKDIWWDGICSPRRAELEVRKEMNGWSGGAFEYDLSNRVAFTDLKPALS